MFVADDRFARDFYQQLTGRREGGGANHSDLRTALSSHSLIAVDARAARNATVLSANGAAPARLTLARFHTGESCGAAAIVTELVFAFPPGGAGGRSTPPSHVTVVALLDEQPFASGAGSPAPALTRADTRELVNRVAQRAESSSRGARGKLEHQLTVDPDQAADAGEVIPVRSLPPAGGGAYAVGFRARYVTAASDTLLVTGVALTDPALRELRWVVRPQRYRLRGGMIPAASPPRSDGQGVRYSLRGAVAGSQGGMLLLIDEIADVSLRQSRATAVDPATRRVVAAQPLALRCP